jgi:hypothetical protein
MGVRSNKRIEAKINYFHAFHKTYRVRKSSPSSRHCVTFRNMQDFVGLGVVRIPLNPQAVGQPLVWCTLLSIRSCPPYVEVSSSISNLRIRCIIVTSDRFNMALS